MQKPLFLLSFALANLSYNGVQYAVTAQSETRPGVLSGEDMMRILPGNTLLAYDESGPFWMYFPEPGTVWGQSSSGDVDIGRWWIENGRYCRSWRLWYDGATQCWTLATYGDNRLFWMDAQQSVQGESLINQGNAIGTIRPPLLASAADIEIDPIAVTGTIGPEPRTRFADTSSDHNTGQTGASSSSGGSSGGSSARDSSGGSSGGGSSGGTSGGNEFSDGGGSSGGGSGGSSSADGSSGGGSSLGGGSSSGGGESSGGGPSSGEGRQSSGRSSGDKSTDTGDGRSGASGGRSGSDTGSGEGKSGSDGKGGKGKDGGKGGNGKDGDKGGGKGKDKGDRKGDRGKH